MTQTSAHSPEGTASTTAQTSLWRISDAGYYLKGGSSLVANQVVNLALGLVTTYLLTGYASKETYGHFTYMLSAMAVASLAGLPGADTAILYGSSKGYPGALRHGTFLRLRAIWVGVIGMLLFAAGLALTGQGMTALSVAIGAALLPLLQAFSGFAAFLQGQARFAEYAIVNILIEIGKVLALALAVFVLRLDGLALVTVFFLAAGILTTAACRRYLTESQGEPGPDFRTMSLSLTGVAALTVLASQADRLTVGTVLGMTPLAGYGLAVTLTDPLRSLGRLIGQLLFPKIVQMDTLAPRFLRKYALALCVLAAALFVLVMAYWVGFPLLQPVLFSGYAESVVMIRWLIVATSLSIFQNVAVQVLWGLPDLRTMYATQFALPILRIAALGVGARLSGITGILVAQVLYSSVAAAWTLIYILALAVRARKRRTDQPDAAAATHTGDHPECGT